MIAKFILSIYVALIAFEEISLLNVVAIKSTSTLMRDVNRNRKNTVSSVDFGANSKHILNTVGTTTTSSSSSSTTKAKNDDFFTFEDLQNNVVATSSIKLLVDQIYQKIQVAFARGMIVDDFDIDILNLLGQVEDLATYYLQSHSEDRCGGQETKEEEEGDGGGGGGESQQLGDTGSIRGNKSPQREVKRRRSMHKSLSNTTEAPDHVAHDGKRSVGMRHWFRHRLLVSSFLPFKRKKAEVETYEFMKKRKVVLKCLKHILGDMLEPCFDLHFQCISEYCVSTFDEYSPPSSYADPSLDSILSQTKQKKKSMLKIFDRHYSKLACVLPVEIIESWSISKEEREKLTEYMDKRIDEVKEWHLPPGIDDDELYDELFGNDKSVNNKWTSSSKSSEVGNNRFDIIPKLLFRVKHNLTFLLYKKWRQATPEVKWFVAKLALPLFLNYMQGMHVLLWQRRVAIRLETQSPMYPMF